MLSRAVISHVLLALVLFVAPVAMAQEGAILRNFPTRTAAVAQMHQFPVEITIDQLTPASLAEGGTLYVHFTVYGGVGSSATGQVIGDLDGLPLTADPSTQVPPLPQRATHSGQLLFASLTVGDHSLTVNYQEQVGTGYETRASARTTVSVPPPITDQLRAAEIILFEQPNLDETFNGHKHVFIPKWLEDQSVRTPYNSLIQGNIDWGNLASSLVILHGSWILYRDWGFEGQYRNTLGPGLYTRLEDIDIKDNDITSLQPGEGPPSVHGTPITGHMILFQEPDFRGYHRHLFTGLADMGWWSDRTSSIIVVSGSWSLYRDAGFNGQYRNVLGPGLYPSLDAVDVRNDDLSSVQPTAEAVSVSGQPLEGHLILFQDHRYEGTHHHIFAADTRMGYWNDRASSIAVLGGTWSLFRDYDFQGEYRSPLTPGLYPTVESVDIKNDDISSVRP